MAATRAENAAPASSSAGMQAKGGVGSKFTILDAGAALADDEELSSPEEDEESFDGFAPALDLRFFFPAGRAPALHRGSQAP